YQRSLLDPKFILTNSVGFILIGRPGYVAVMRPVLRRTRPSGRYPAKKNRNSEKNLQRKRRKLSILAQDPPGKFQVSTAPDPGASCRFFLGFFSGTGNSPVEPEMAKGGSMNAKL